MVDVLINIGKTRTHRLKTAMENPLNSYNLKNVQIAYLSPM